MTEQLTYDMFTPPEEVFSANTSCIPGPHMADEPYYVAREKLRSNIKEAKQSDAIDLLLGVQ